MLTVGSLATLVASCLMDAARSICCTAAMDVICTSASTASNVRPSAAAATTVGWWTTFSAKKRKPLSGLTSSKVSDSKGLKGFRVRSGVLPEYALTANAATFRSLSTDRGGSAAASSSSSEYSISSATFCSADSGSLK